MRVVYHNVFLKLKYKYLYTKIQIVIRSIGFLFWINTLVFSTTFLLSKWHVYRNFLDYYFLVQIFWFKNPIGLSFHLLGQLLVLFVRFNCSMIQEFWSILKCTDLGMHSTILSSLWLYCFGLWLIFVLITFCPLGLNEIHYVPAFLLSWKEMLWKVPGMKFVLFVRSNCSMNQEFRSILKCTDLGMYLTVLLFGGLFVVMV